MLRLFIMYPSALRALSKGGGAYAEEVQRRTKRDFLAHPDEVVRAKGFTMFLNPSDGIISAEIARAHFYELDVTPVFESYLSGAKVVVDAGANIGWFTLVAGKKAPTGAVVLAFEPNATNFWYLAKSIEANHFSNVKTFNVALSDRVGTALLRASPDGAHPGMHSIVFDFDTSGVEVPTTTLAKTLEDLNLREIDVLKLDVEGAEPRVLKGAGALFLERRIRNIFIEWIPSAWKLDMDIVAFLEQNYEVFGLRWTKTIRFADLTSIAQRENLFLRLRG